MSYAMAMLLSVALGGTFAAGTALGATVTLNANRDTWIDQSAQTTNHGTDTAIDVKGRATAKQRTLVAFDLTTVPDCATVTEAKLRLHVDSNSLATSVNHNLHRLMVDWSEGASTWLSRDGTNNWGAPGAVAGTDFDATQTASAATGTGAGFVEWDVTGDVLDFLGGTETNYGWIVKHAVEGGANTNDNNTIVAYASRENGTAANRPQLEITYTPSNAECDDLNPCTTDTCGALGCENTPNSDPCDDGMFCNGSDTCSGGTCTHAGDPCSGPDGDGNCSESCDEATDTCTAADPDGSFCNDSVFCNGTDTCSGGSCSAHAGDPCTGPDGDTDCSESCDEAAGNCLAADPDGTPCRASSGECDVAETCLGGSCPADSFEPQGTACTPDGEICTADECDGNNDCTHPAGNAGTECRAASVGQACDQAEQCDGINTTCPADGVKPQGTECRTDTGECDVAEVCDGVNSACPPNAFEPAGTSCTPDNEICTRDECDGNNQCAHPAGNAGTECRAASVGQACDQAEQCDGVNPSCPADGVKSQGTECRADTGECDVAEVCDGVNFGCPPDGFEPLGTPCTPDGQICTVDQCDGENQCTHPAGNAGTVCRPDAGECDVAEQCDGTSTSCPADGFEPNGTPCSDDELYCTGAETCQAGSCTSGGDPCTAGVCDEGTDQCVGAGCETAPLAGCRSAAKSIFLVKNNSDDGKDKLIWKWINGQSTDKAEFADPTDNADYTLCVYSGTGEDLVAELVVPPSSSKWKASKKGFKYKDPSGTEDGVRKVVLKSSASNKAKAIVKGKGMELPDLPAATDTSLALDLPVKVQLVNEDNGTCVEANYGAGDVKKNVPAKFKGKAQ